MAPLPVPLTLQAQRLFPCPAWDPWNSVEVSITLPAWVNYRVSSLGLTASEQGTDSHLHNLGGMFNLYNRHPKVKGLFFSHVRYWQPNLNLTTR